MHRTFKQIKKWVIGVVGVIVTLAGIAMLVLPGPAFLVIPAGLGILATEFEWARKLLHTFKERFDKEIEKIKKKREARKQSKKDSSA
ncbi:MAG: PGPGW domain-containing protein [Syntrophothermus sp.]